MRRLNTKRSLGQGMTEYIIIVALIAIAAITVYTFFGQTVRNQVGGLAEELSGSANTGIAASKKSATDTSTEAKKEKGMGTYDNTVK